MPAMCGSWTKIMAMPWPMFERQSLDQDRRLIRRRPSQIHRRYLYTQDGGSHWVQSTWKITGSDGFTTNYVIRGNSDVWIIGGIDQSGATSGRPRLFHSHNGGVSFNSAFPVPSYLSSPNVIALLNQNGTSTLLVLDASGALARTVLPTN